jgi:hypothetical protein
MVDFAASRQDAIGLPSPASAPCLRESLVGAAPGCVNTKALWIARFPAPDVNQRAERRKFARLARSGTRICADNAHDCARRDCASTDENRDGAGCVFQGKGDLAQGFHSAGRWSTDLSGILGRIRIRLLFFETVYTGCVTYCPHVTAWYGWLESRQDWLKDCVWNRLSSAVAMCKNMVSLAWFLHPTMPPTLSGF